MEKTCLTLRLAVVCALCSVFLCLQPLHAVDWPYYRGPNRNSILAERVRLRPDGPRKLWDAQTGHGNASLVIAKGRLYTHSTGNHNLFCFDAKTGDQLWTRRMATYFGDSTPSVENDRLYFLPSTKTPTAYCYDAITGEVIWTRDLLRSSKDRQYGHAGSPLLWEDLVILNVGSGTAVRKSTGEVVWQHEGFAGLATPVLFQWQNRACVALFGGDQLTARDARTGQLLWSIPWDTGELAVNACDPIIFNNKIFLTSDYGRGRALYDFSGGKPQILWEFGQGKGSVFSSGFFRDGCLFTVAESKFSCLDVVTGTPRWQANFKGQSLLIGDILICVSEAGTVNFARISPAGFELLSSFQAGIKDIKSMPAYCEGKLYLHNYSGQIVCFEIGDVI